ncbi:hypothetical protein ACSQ67_025329 [Phaseolus vulgaris]
MVMTEERKARLVGVLSVRGNATTSKAYPSTHPAPFASPIAPLPSPARDTPTLASPQVEVHLTSAKVLPLRVEIAELKVASAANQVKMTNLEECSVTQEVHPGKVEAELAEKDETP